MTIQQEIKMQNKVALITGAAKRVGAVIAKTLHHAGMNVVIHYSTSSKEAENVCQELNAIRKNSAVSIQADLENIDIIAGFIEKVVAAFQRVDVLVNNASSFYPTKIGEGTQQDWHKLFATNVQAPFFLSQALTPYLKKVKGNIINMVDIHADKPLKQHTIYCMSKAALVMMTKSLARELAPEIRVNAIAPGVILWPQEGMPEKIQQSILDRVALKRAGNPQHIADTIVFLLNNDYVTGEIINVDGGRSLFV
jgi:pteridine reductase